MIQYTKDSKTDKVNISKEAIEKLKASIRCQIIQPGDPDYEDARKVWNGLIDKRPALIAQCSGTADVIDSVNFARDNKLRPLRELSAPLADLSGQMPYTTAQTLFDPFLPKHERNYYFKSQDLSSLDDEVIDAIIARTKKRPIPSILIAIWHYGGKMKSIGNEKTAFGSRDTTFLFSVDSIWDDPGDSDRVIAWSRKFLKEMKPYAGDGMYVNFSGFGEEGEKLVRSAYGGNYERLQKVKSKYDPDNFFHMNQNIEPA